MSPPRQLAAANKIFVDREIPQKIFEDAAFAIPVDRSTVCVFYGVAGQGKTALCREMIRKTDPAVEPSYDFLRRAELNLHGRSKTDPDLLLVWIRNSFVKSGFDLPANDLTLALTWAATRPEQPFPKLTKPWLGRITEGAEAGVDQEASAAADWLKSDAATDLVGDFVDEIPGIGFILKKIGKWAIDKTKKAYLFRTRESLKELYSNGELKKPYELSKLLPWMLAQDLNFHIAAHPKERLVLLSMNMNACSTKAAPGRVGRKILSTPISGHLYNIPTVCCRFFSRERLPWENDPDWRDDRKNAQHLLGGLKDKAFDRGITPTRLAC